jgi:hypothetical protein
MDSWIDGQRERDEVKQRCWEKKPRERKRNQGHQESNLDPPPRPASRRRRGTNTPKRPQTIVYRTLFLNLRLFNDAFLQKQPRSKRPLSRPSQTCVLSSPCYPARSRHAMLYLVCDNFETNLKLHKQSASPQGAVDTPAAGISVCGRPALCFVGALELVSGDLFPGLGNKWGLPGVQGTTTGVKALSDVGKVCPKIRVVRILWVYLDFMSPPPYQPHSILDSWRC